MAPSFGLELKIVKKKGKREIDRLGHLDSRALGGKGGGGGRDLKRPEQGTGKKPRSWRETPSWPEGQTSPTKGEEKS